MRGEKKIFCIVLLVAIFSGCVGAEKPGDIGTTEAPAEPSEPPITIPPTDAPKPKVQTSKVFDLDVIYKTDNTPKPSWLVDNFEGSAPWEGSVYIARSDDGLTFGNEKLFVDRAGVPNLLLTSDNGLVATFQYFSFEHEEMFDVIAYAVSGDFGNTWSKVNRIFIEGLPITGPGGPNPVDPTLVQLEDGSYRLYYTYHSPGKKYPGLYSARSDTLDTPFKSEGPQLETDKMILDPAVIYFNGAWHHYTVRHNEKSGGKFVNVHSTSTDGQNFKLQDDILLEFQFLGQVIEDRGTLRFYGSGDGVESATSSDGYTWTKDPGRRTLGADPGIAKLPDGSYLMIYTKLPPIN